MKKTISFLADRLSATNDSEASSSQSSYLKRREQVRRAQRTHRERKDKYFKALESEVLQLREIEANFVAQMDELNAYIVQLQDVLKANGIALPAPPSEPVYQRLSGQLVSDAHAAETDRLSGINDDGESSPLRCMIVLENGGSLTTDTAIPVQTTEITPSITDTSGIANGMEFVLTLEKPCLSHIDTDLTKSDQPSGHVLTATMPLLHLHRYPESFNSQENPLLTDSLSIFDRLAALSSELVAEDEYTPIQMWNYIVNNSNSNSKSLLLAVNSNENGDVGVHHQLQVLAENMLQHVQCHGFGAVVKKDICEKLISEMFTVS